MKKLYELYIILLRNLEVYSRICELTRLLNHILAGSLYFKILVRLVKKILFYNRIIFYFVIRKGLIK